MLYFASRWKAMLRNGELSSELTPNSQQDRHSKVPCLSLWFSPTRPHILARCTPNPADSTPFGSFTGAVKRNALKSLTLTQLISQSRTIQPQDTQRWVTGNKNKTSAESHTSHLSLSCFQRATKQTQSVRVGFTFSNFNCLKVKYLFKEILLTKGETLAGNNLSHASRAHILGQTVHCLEESVLGILDVCSAA